MNCNPVQILLPSLQTRSSPNVIKLFTVAIYKFLEQVRVFVPA
jgi:hypothetical protein